MFFVAKPTHSVLVNPGLSGSQISFQTVGAAACLETFKKNVLHSPLASFPAIVLSSQMPGWSWVPVCNRPILS